MCMYIFVRASCLFLMSQVATGCSAAHPVLLSISVNLGSCHWNVLRLCEWNKSRRQAVFFVCYYYFFNSATGRL